MGRAEFPTVRWSWWRPSSYQTNYPAVLARGTLLTAQGLPQALPWKTPMRKKQNKTHAQHQNHTAELKWLKPFDFKNMHLEIALFRWHLTTSFYKVQGKPFLISMLKRTAQTRTISPGYQLSPGNGMLGSSSFLTFSQQQARLVLTTQPLQHTTLPSPFLILPLWPALNGLSTWALSTMIPDSPHSTSN